ncbi:MAG: RsmG family class I SAM-dependent methyltransferase, partial [Flavobacteriales bacterium]
MQLIDKYFPNLTPHQREQFNRLEALYNHWNDQINVISRKDTENFYERHVLHSLGIAKVMEFKSNSDI